MREPERRAKEILSICLHDPDVDKRNPQELYQACCELADEVCLYSETKQELFKLTLGNSYTPVGDQQRAGRVAAEYPDPDEVQDLR